MKKAFGRIGSLWPFLIILILLAVLIAVGIRYNNLNPDMKDVMGIMTKKLEILSRMRINLLKSVEAEKMAVMADTDESSRTYADESQKTVQVLEKDRRELGLLIREDPTARETKLLQEFDLCWTEFRKTDRVLLGFAVRNTNLKAAHLSFTKGSEAVKGLEESLGPLISRQSFDKEDFQIARLACKVLTAGLKIHYLQAPHIAAANNEQMDKIERAIKQKEEVIKAALKELKNLARGDDRLSLQKAGIACDELEKVTAQVIDLSRQNTNIKSFELSLGRKRKLTAQCDEILLSLEEAVRSRSFKATR